MPGSGGGSGNSGSGCAGSGISGCGAGTLGISGKGREECGGVASATMHVLKNGMELSCIQ